MLATGKPVPEVAQQYGFSKHTFYRVINGERHNQAVRDLIAHLSSNRGSDLACLAGRPNPGCPDMSGLKSPPKKKIAQATIELTNLRLDLFAFGADDLPAPASELFIRLEPFERLACGFSAVAARDFDSVEHILLTLNKKIPRLLQVGKIRPQVMLLALLILAGAGGFVNFFMGNR